MIRRLRAFTISAYLSAMLVSNLMPNRSDAALAGEIDSVSIGWPFSPPSWGSTLEP